MKDVQMAAKWVDARAGRLGWRDELSVVVLAASKAGQWGVMDYWSVDAWVAARAAPLVG